MTTRASGVLLHPTSLPGPFGIGDFGESAQRFLAWLEDAGQSVWQMLPLGPVGLGYSPYDASSAFAGNPLLISPQSLCEWGLLKAGDLEAARLPANSLVDFPAVTSRKEELLRRAWRRFETGQGSVDLQDQFEPWVHRQVQVGWLEDWALFAALKRQGLGSAWSRWPEPLRQRRPDAVAKTRVELTEEVAYEQFVQFVFYRQWAALHEEAQRRGIQLLGDLPFYVAFDSCDVWAHPEIFHLDTQGRPSAVAGVPPDYFSPTGQRWGNPIYRWRALAEQGFRWWLDRFAFQLRLVDRLRLDHFRAFVAYWEIDADQPTAEDGRWQEGPGLALFEAAQRELHELPIIAEDLGLITPDVHHLREQLDIPGMAVLQFAFDTPTSQHLPHHLSRDTVLYTGTHDNDTAVGWLASSSPESRRRALDYVGGSEQNFHWNLIRAALTSVADLVIIPAQDILGLDGSHRMNTPGSPEGNWRWRLTTGALGIEAARRLGRLSEVSGRLPAPDTAD